jgi:hypothetical protein
MKTTLGLEEASTMVVNHTRRLNKADNMAYWDMMLTLMSDTEVLGLGQQVIQNYVPIMRYILHKRLHRDSRTCNLLDIDNAALVLTIHLLLRLYYYEIVK